MDTGQHLQKFNCEHKNHIQGGIAGVQFQYNIILLLSSSQGLMIFLRKKRP